LLFLEFVFFDLFSRSTMQGPCKGEEEEVLTLLTLELSLTRRKERAATGVEEEDGAEVDDGVGDANEQALMLLLREDNVEEEEEDADSIPCSGGIDGG
jgi:hypothetical protein